jgi:FkbM family methyltransferase
MNYKDRLKAAIDEAIRTNYEIHERAINVRTALYSHKNVCIFGTGEFFDDCATLEHLERFEYVADNDPGKWGKLFKGRKCLSPNEIAQMEDIAVLIMVGEWRPIYEQLKAMNIECYPMDWYSMNVYDPHYSNEWFEERRNIIEDTVDLFEDETSKEIYVEAICNRIAPSCATKIFNEIKTPGEYFETDVFSMGPEEYLVDAGAYKGDSIEKLLAATDGKFGRIYSFELDSVIFEELKKTAAKYDRERIELFNAGVSNEVTEVEYAYVAGDETHVEQVTTIDTALMGKKVTLIKMDVETFELKALEGAKHIIVEQRPKLAISAYHYLSDLWEVPRKIKEMVPEYKLYLRHHSPAVWDTDCYAYVDSEERCI